MKKKITTLLMIVFMLGASSLLVQTVKAEEVTSEVETTIDETEEATDPVVKSVKVTKTITVNKNLKLKKSLNITKKEFKGCKFISDKKSVATVSKDGIITGLKAGTATITVKSDSVNAKVKVNVKNKFSEKALRYVSAIVYAEARGESYAGQKAVAHVVMNRVRSELFPNTITGVLYQRGQFTPAVNGSLYKALVKYDSGKMKKSCLKAATEVLNGDTTVTLSNGDVDFTKYLFFSRYIPRAKLSIGGHQFK